jgi:hypothetical protein
LTGSGKSFLRRRDFKEGDKERLLDGLGGVAAVQQTPQILLLDPEEMPIANLQYKVAKSKHQMANLGKSATSSQRSG